MSRQNPLLRWFVCGWVGIVALCGATSASAQDVRLAFLVANPQGWKDDPYLKYIVKGDLEPMARSLRNLGFHIHTTLVNGSARQFRIAFQKLLVRLRQKPTVTTLFFYYTGHADRKAFHLGGPRNYALGYKEFISMLRKVRVKRRFVMLDACFGGQLIREFGSLEQAKRLVKKGGTRVPVDLRKFYKSEPPTRGIQIISSSSTFAFESPKHRGSVFTHYFLKGMKGGADVDRNGAISFQELFVFASREVQKETIQKPQRFIYQVGQDYPFAPNYAGRLLIPSSITGHVKVVIGNFVWRHHKTKKRPLWLRVNTGRGSVEIKSKQGCLRKTIVVKRQGWAALTRKGTEKNCQDVPPIIAKGDPDSQVYLEPQEFSPWRSVQPWSLEVRAGLLGTSGLLYEKGDWAGVFSVGMRHRYGGLFLSVWGTEQAFSSRSASYLGVEARGELGYGLEWTRFHLFLGAFLTAGVVVQDLGQVNNIAGVFRGGGTLSLVIRITPQWGLTFAGDIGTVPANFGQGLQWFVYGSASAGVRFSFPSGE
ncbi:MAG: caspase family protein [Deltaproteobacteria bacterium]|nr:MAG: caspase family protein [Deltaproteobacteria bacterium]